MGKKKKKHKDPLREREFPLALFRIQAEDAQASRSKKLRKNEPPEEYKKEKATRFRRSEEERVAQASVDLITDQIKGRMDLESRTGRRHAIVYSFGATEFRPKNNMLSSSHHDYSICCEEWLIGAARGVYEYCVKKQLKPTIERWQGDPSLPATYGFNIVVHF